MNVEEMVRPYSEARNFPLAQNFKSRSAVAQSSNRMNLFSISSGVRLQDTCEDELTWEEATLSKLRYDLRATLVSGHGPPNECSLFYSADDSGKPYGPVPHASKRG